MANSPGMAHEYALRAEGDYRTAAALFRARDEWTVNNVCYHCQQAAEKWLKAFLDERKGEHGKTHDLVSLLNACQEIDASFSELEDCCEQLNGLDVDARYPDNHIAYDFEDARETLDHCERIRAFITPRLKCWPGIEAMRP